MATLAIKDFIEKYRAVYKTFTPVYCPALKTKIIFQFRRF